MKSLINIGFLIGFVLAFTACGEEENHLFDDKNAYFAFTNTRESVLEDESQALMVPVHLARTQYAGKVSFSIDVEGFDNPAIEGVDYQLVNESNELSYTDGLTQHIMIQPIDNEEKDGARKFRINLESNGSTFNIGMTGGAGSTIEVTIGDNDVTLDDLPGVFFLYEETLEPASYTYEVKILPHEDENTLILNNLWALEKDLILKFDPEIEEVRIPAGQTWSSVDIGIGEIVDVQIVYVNIGEQRLDTNEDIVGEYSLGEGLITFPMGYALLVVSPGSEFYGLAFYSTIQTYCSMTRTGDLPNETNALKKSSTSFERPMSSLSYFTVN